MNWLTEIVRVCSDWLSLAGWFLVAILSTLKAGALATLALDVGVNVGAGGVAGSAAAGAGSSGFDPQDLPYVGPEPGGGTIGDHWPSRCDGLGDPIDPDTGQPMRTPRDQRPPCPSGGSPPSTATPSATPTSTPGTSPFQHPIQYLQELAKDAVDKAFNPDYQQ